MKSEFEKNLKKMKSQDKKDKKKKIKYKSLFYLTLTNYKFVLMDMIFQINGIDKDDYFYSEGINLNLQFKFNKKFKQMSQLGFLTKDRDEKDSIKFRGRYATKILFFIFKNMEGIIDVLYNEDAKFDELPKEYKTKIKILQEFTKRINAFISTFLTGDAYYQEHLESLMQFIFIYKKKEKSVNIITTFNEQAEFVREACKTREYGDDVLINNILKLAYFMTTENKHLKVCPKFIEGLTLNDKEILREQISDLGHVVLKRLEKDGLKSMFKIFWKSSMKYYSKYPDINNDVELIVGTKALMYLCFLLDDEYVDKYISNII